MSGIAAVEANLNAVSSSGGTFTFQLLHASDWEAGVKALERAGNFAAIIDILEEQYENTLILSSGDGWIPGPFYASGADSALAATYQAVYSAFFSAQADGVTFTALGAAAGRADVAIQNIIGVEVATFGNHEFDGGTSAIRDIIATLAGADGIFATADDVNIGTLFPYLSANLDFSGDSNLASLFTNEIREASSFAGDTAKKIAPSAVITKGGEKIAVIAATTQGLATISSPGDTVVIGATSNDISLLATQINDEVARVLASDPSINKVIVSSHLQQLDLEKQLAPLLENVDIIVAGGSHTRLADANDDLRDGDLAQGDYPFLTANKDGDPLLIVNTDNEFSYVGRLVVEFDAEGRIIVDSLDNTINGAYVTTDEKVAELWGNEDAFAEGTKGHLVNQIIWGVDGDQPTKGIGTVIQEQDGNILGRTDVFLEGRRAAVRTEETNLGNLTADANLAEARKVDTDVVVSIKNGGGIRDAIGFVNAVGGEAVLAPPAANPDAGKKEGDISQLDIVNSLRFNNDLAIVTLTAEGLALAFEHGLSGIRPGATPGSFPQIGGARVFFDATQPVGSRIIDLDIVDENGNVIESIVADGELAGNASRAIKVVTLTYLAEGGDGYTAFVENRVPGTDLVKLTEALEGEDGAADFAKAGTEQDAFAEYLKANYSETPYNEAETPVSEDGRVVNYHKLAVGVRNNDLGGHDINVNDAGRLSAEHGSDGVDRVFYSGDSAVKLPGNIEQIILSGTGNISVTGNALDNTFIGNAGDNTFTTGGGNDFVDGATGFDVVRLEGAASRYTVSVENTVAVIVDGNTGAQTTVANVQQIRFADGTQDLFSVDQTEIAGIYRALLGRAADDEGFNYWVGRSADDEDLASQIHSFRNSEEGRAFVSGKTNEQLVDSLYANVLDREADAEGRAYWLDELQSGFEFHRVAESFITSAEFQLVGTSITAGDWELAA